MRKKATKGTIAFRITFMVFSCILIVFIAFALYYLWNFLAAYEQSQPELAADSLINQINKNKSSFFDKLNVSFNEFEDVNTAKSYFKELTKGEITYTRNGRESNETITVYNIKADGKTVATATVKKSNQDLGYGFYKYKVEDVKFGEVPTYSYSVTAPSNAVVMCNGKELSTEYITETGTVYEDTKNFLNYTEDFPYNVTYTVDGFIGTPEFTAKDIFGNELTQTDGIFTLEKTKNEELSNIALQFSKSYSRYIMDDGELYAVSEFLAPNTKIYENLSNYNNYWCRTHYGYDFLDINVEDPLFYNKNAAMVHLKYDHVLYNVPDTENNEFHSIADFNIYMVNLNGEWKVVEMVING